MMVGSLLSFWDGIFSVAMLNFQGVMFFVGKNGVLFAMKYEPKWLGCAYRDEQMSSLDDRFRY